MFIKSSGRIPVSFFDREAPIVAPALLGKILVRQYQNSRLAGIIIETEAYQDEEDLACHARAGRTPRTEVMYWAAGHAYVYFTYGMHWLLNCVTDNKNVPSAVLIRAILPIDGLNIIAKLRKNRPQREWCNGPAKLCQALAINGSFNGSSLVNNGTQLWIEDAESYEKADIISGPRVGINTVPEPWKSKPWRFLVKQYQQTLAK